MPLFIVHSYSHVGEGNEHKSTPFLKKKIVQMGYRFSDETKQSSTIHYD